MEVWKELKEKLYPGDEWIIEKKKRNGEIIYELLKKGLILLNDMPKHYPRRL